MNLFSKTIVAICAVMTIMLPALAQTAGQGNEWNSDSSTQIQSYYPNENTEAQKARSITQEEYHKVLGQKDFSFLDHWLHSGGGWCIFATILVFSTAGAKGHPAGIIIGIILGLILSLAGSYYAYITDIHEYGGGF